MINLSLTELTQIVGAQPSMATQTFSGVSIDTRTLHPGSLFVVIQGENLDGHDFVIEAGQKGAAAALVSRLVDSPLPQIQVPDTIDALGKLSANWRQRFAIPFIGVTGSNGKTTLKNMIASILRAACDNNATEVLATQGNFNNHIGLPLSLLRLNTHHRYAVVEMGMNHFGEIAYLSELANPMRVAVITNAAEAHLEGVKNIAGVARAKGEIFLGLQKNGVAVLNSDDAHFSYWRNLVKNYSLLSFGLKNPADITAVIQPDSSILLHTPQGSIDIRLPLLGTHNTMNALAATAATLAIGIDLETIKKGLEQITSAPGRMQESFLPSGTRIINDTYNANPFSLQAAISTLAAFPGTRILVLGDMKELGPDEKKLHYQAGEKIRAAGIQHLFTLGELSAATTEAFGKDAQHFTEFNTLISALQPYLTPDNTLLIKGSRSMRMERIINTITI